MQLLHHTGDRALAAGAASLPHSILGKEAISTDVSHVVPKARLTMLVAEGGATPSRRHMPTYQVCSRHAARPPFYAPQTALTLAWTAPADNGSPIVCYTLERDDGAGGDFTHVYAGPNTTHTIKGLRPGLQYRFRLRADNDVSLGAWTALVLWQSRIAPRRTPLPVA